MGVGSLYRAALERGLDNSKSGRLARAVNQGYVLDIQHLWERAADGRIERQPYS